MITASVRPEAGSQKKTVCAAESLWRWLMKANPLINLPNDVSRCLGSSCIQRDTCERYLQIERDKSGKDPFAMVVYTNLPGDENCKSKIESIN